LTRSMAELHQATMLIDSDKGKGTRVRITFPPERTLLIARDSVAAAG